jgi:predicted TIM-barrel fold metal-dependent hydrolase
VTHRRRVSPGCPPPPFLVFSSIGSSLKAACKTTFAKEVALPIDCHAHVFTRDLTLANQRRYSVDYDATIAEYLALLDDTGLRGGVLVQPSFLGSDNAYLLAALAAAPRRLRGIAVVPVGVSDSALSSLERRGVVGIRLNLIGRPDPDFDDADWRAHLARIAARDWQIEVQCEAGRLPALLPPLLRSGAKLVIDHFGRPDARTGVDDPGFRSLLEFGPSRNVWVKLSGAYRLGAQGIALAAAPLLRDAFGLDRLLWGSDWPHTQFETVATPASALAELERWIPGAADRLVVLRDTPNQLFGF